MKNGHNWRNTLTAYASISGVLAGFCITFIGIILGWSLTDIQIIGEISSGQISILFFGLSTCLFIASAEFFLTSKNYDLFDLSEKYENWLEKDFEKNNQDWYDIRNNAHEKCRLNESYGSFCYNTSIYIMFIGLGFAILPYSFGIALIVAVLGISLESIQLLDF